MQLSSAFVLQETTPSFSELLDVTLEELFVTELLDSTFAEDSSTFRESWEDELWMELEDLELSISQSESLSDVLLLESSLQDQINKEIKPRRKIFFIVKNISLNFYFLQ